MDKIHAVCAALKAMMLFKIIGIVPVYFPVGLLAAAMLNQAIKVAQWTTAQRGIELAFRAVLKIPVVGVWLATIPLLGALLHYLANDTANLPPTFMMRIRAKKAKAAAPPVATPPAVVILFLVGLTALSGCGFGTCLLGKLKASQEALIADVASTLPTQNWEAALTGLVPIAGEAAVDCTVQAIVTYEQQKQAAIAARSTTPPHADIIASQTLVHGQTWLAKHPAKSCRDVAPMMVAQR
jgi:hypothetical protein